MGLHVRTKAPGRPVGVAWGPGAGDAGQGSRDNAEATEEKAGPREARVKASINGVTTFHEVAL